MQPTQSCVIVLNPALVITEPAVLSATVAKTNVTCFGAGDGTITINGAAGGYGTYEYTIDGGATWQASNSFTALIPGFYNVKIRDAANTGCVITLNGSLKCYTTRYPCCQRCKDKCNMQRAPLMVQ